MINYTTANMTPPPEELRERLEYLDGKLFWKRRYNNRIPSDRRAGNLGADGYRKLGFTHNGVMRQYKEHRLIWWLFTGEWPEVVDHIDRDTQNNHIHNLRSATYSENMRNRSVGTNCKTGVLGIFIDKQIKESYSLNIRLDGKSFTKRGYKDLKTATLARDILAHLLHGDFASLTLLDKAVNIEVNKNEIQRKVSGSLLS